jgi:hypothetical protein
MWNGYPQYRRSGIRFFPHIIPIAFPLIFPFGIGLAFWLFHALLPILGFLIFVGVVFFIIRTVMLGSPQSAWNSMRNTGTQWQQRFTPQQQQQPPYYQPSTPQQPYYQPTPQAEQQPQYGQGYQPSTPTGTPYYQPTTPTQPYYQSTPQAEQQVPYYQPKANKPEEMPPME